MNIEAFVPIKLNNTRLPGKNIKDFGGKPLCWRIFETLHNAGLKPYVFCSDESIMKYVPKYVRLLKRSKWLDRDEANATELTTVFREKVDADIYIQAYCTAPFLKPDTIVEGLKAMKNHDSSLTVERLQIPLWRNGKPLNHNPNKVVRSQDMDIIYKETTGLYIYKKEVCEGGARTGNNPYFIEVDQQEGIDIDNKEDFDFAEKLLCIQDQ